MICRLCLNELKEFVSIFEKSNAKSANTIAKMIAKYLHVEIHTEDSVSKKICMTCWMHLDDFHKFWLFIEEKQQYLQNEVLDSTYEPCNESNRKQLSESQEECKSLTFPENKNLLHEQQIDAPFPDEQQLLAVEEFEAAFDYGEGSVNMMEDYEACIVDCEKSASVKKGSTKNKVTNRRKSPRGKAKLNAFQKNTRTCLQIDKGDDNNNNGKESEPKSAHNMKATIKEHDAYIAEHGTLCCCICKQSLKNFSDLKNHFRKTHKCIGYVPCCNNRYSKRTQYVDHLKIHYDPEFFKCKECDKILANRNSFQNHMASCHPTEEELKFQCSFCTKKFAKQYILDYHLNSHRGGEKNHTCELCQKGYRSLAEMKLHQKRVHLNSFKIMCDLCGKHFKSKQNFQKHSEVMHQAVDRPEAQCKICGKWLKDDRSLYKHMYKHRDENSGKEFICGKCGAVKSTRQTLTSHMRYHHSDTMHKCVLCDKEFKRMLALEEHMATHTGKALYTCSFCPQTFKSHANMHNHKKKMHPNEWVRKYSKPNKITTDENYSNN